MSAAPAASSKPTAKCLLTGEKSEGTSALIINHTPEQTHVHTCQLVADDDGCMLKSLKTSAKTLAHMYGCAPGAIDLIGINGIKIHGATTTHSDPVGITITTANSSGDFAPIQTLTRSCFQRQTHDDMGTHDVGQLCHFIANPASVGYVHPPTEIKLHQSQCADNMATNLCLRQMRWPTMPMDQEYTKVHSDASGEMCAIPMTPPAACNVSYLLQMNEHKLKEIAGTNAKMVESTSGKFAMIQTSALNQIKDKLKASFETKSCFNNGMALNMFPLTGKPFEKGTTTTITYSLMKDPRTLAERTITSGAMDEDVSKLAANIESVRFHNIGAMLGEAGEGTQAEMSAAPAPTVAEHTAELTALVNGK